LNMIGGRNARKKIVGENWMSGFVSLEPAVVWNQIETVISKCA
jgi:hypothetical protein